MDDIPATYQPDADRETVIEYTVRQHTTSKNLDAVQRAFAREVQLQYGRSAWIVQARYLDPAKVEWRFWEHTPPEVKRWVSPESDSAT